MVLLSYNNCTVCLFQDVYAIALIASASNGFANGLLHWEISEVVEDYTAVEKVKSTWEKAPNNVLLIIMILTT